MIQNLDALNKNASTAIADLESFLIYPHRENKIVCEYFILTHEKGDRVGVAMRK